MSESQVRHEHPLDFVQTRNGLDEYVCKFCAACFYQVRECH